MNEWKKVLHANKNAKKAGEQNSSAKINFKTKNVKKTKRNTI